MAKLIPISTSRTLEDAAHFFDIQQRAKLARPVQQGRDILESTPVDTGRVLTGRPLGFDEHSRNHYRKD